MNFETKSREKLPQREQKNIKKTDAVWRGLRGYPTADGMVARGAAARACSIVANLERLIQHDPGNRGIAGFHREKTRFIFRGLIPPLIRGRV